MVLSSKALKEFKMRLQKLLLSLLGDLGNDNKEPKYSEQIYLDLRSYQEKLFWKASNQLKSFFFKPLKSPFGSKAGPGPRGPAADSSQNAGNWPKNDRGTFL